MERRNTLIDAISSGLCVCSKECRYSDKVLNYVPRNVRSPDRQVGVRSWRHILFFISSGSINPPGIQFIYNIEIFGILY